MSYHSKKGLWYALGSIFQDQSAVGYMSCGLPLWQGLGGQNQMIHDLMYIEPKTDYSDDGPAWIGYVKTSKSKKTIYFNDHAIQKNTGNYSNYIDIENGDEYWISGLKKKESNRHWAGHGKIMIDRRAVNEYLELIGEKELPLNLFEVVDIEDRFPVERVKKLLNEKG